MTPDMFRKLAALGLSHDQMAGVLEIMADEAEERKAKARARVQKWRDKQKVETQRNVTERNETQQGDLRAGDARGRDNLQTKIPTGREERKKDAPLARCFPDFWTLYPNKVGKRDAEKAFDKALKRASLETIMAGLRRYVAKTDDRPWCNPATWLNQDRWEDQPATVTPNSHSPPGKRQSAFDANIARRIKRNEPGSGRRSDSDAELLPPDEPELRAIPGFSGSGFSRDFGSGGH